MAMVGEQFLVGDEICGMVLSLRYPWDQVYFKAISTSFLKRCFFGTLKLIAEVVRNFFCYQFAFNWYILDRDPLVLRFAFVFDPILTNESTGFQFFDQ